MKILSIGNSFSQDAQRYIHRIAGCDEKEVYTVNLYIGGCPLESHAKNVKSGERAYAFEENGKDTGRMISIAEAIALADWDVITIQQVSSKSVVVDSYYPYVCEVVDFVKAQAPNAKIVMHETWAYEDGCDRIFELRGDRSAAAMHRDVKNAYEFVAADIKADGIIPSGDLLELMRERSVGKLHRDTFHASLGLGRYAIGLLWYHVLTGADVTENTYRSFDEDVSEEQIAAAKTCVMEFEPIFG